MWKSQKPSNFRRIWWKAPKSGKSVKLGEVAFFTDVFHVCRLVVEIQWKCSESTDDKNFGKFKVFVIYWYSQKSDGKSGIGRNSGGKYRQILKGKLVRFWAQNLWFLLKDGLKVVCMLNLIYSTLIAYMPCAHVIHVVHIYYLLLI